jgi:hypothetical protein
MVGPCKRMEAGAMPRRTMEGRLVIRKKERKTSFEMDGRCCSRFEGNEDKTVDREGGG